MGVCVLARVLITSALMLMTGDLLLRKTLHLAVRSLAFRASPSQPFHEDDVAIIKVIRALVQMLKNVHVGAASIFRIPQHLLLHEGRAWSDAQYGRAFIRLKVAA